MKEFKTALKEVLNAEKGEGNMLPTVNRVEKTGNFLIETSDFDVIYFQEPADRHLAGDNKYREVLSRVNVYCLVKSDKNNREPYENQVEELAWQVVDVILLNPTLQCTSYPQGFCNRASTKIGEIRHLQGTLTKNQVPVEVSVFEVQAKYIVRN